MYVIQTNYKRRKSAGMIFKPTNAAHHSEPPKFIREEKWSDFEVFGQTAVSETPATWRERIKDYDSREPSVNIHRSPTRDRCA